MRSLSLRRVVGGITAAAAVAAGLAAPAAAEPEDRQTEPRTAPVTTKVTLITGDVLTVRDFADEHMAITADPAGPSRGIVSLHAYEGRRYAIPAAAQQAVNTGRIDRELFNVGTLLDAGYGTAAPIPVIVDNADTAKAPATPAKARAGLKLESINALAVSVAGRDARTFWGSYDTPADLSARGVDKLWLDGTVTVDLADSVPRIGAPDAWAAGYDGDGVTVAVLDTGVDATHPDLTGRVTEARNFTTTADAVDHHGHGTHVASTVAGTGAGNGHPGVAPKADLVIGKVLDDSGSGTFSAIIDGMEWAAHSADVINMSLGSDAPDDGTGPLSVAIDTLTEETGALFVVAAGNSGRQLIGSPASASEALTVGAVSKTDALAPFSTRGPRSGDAAVKPEVSGPGVDIIAARAAGTTMGTPVDDRYTTASGTSMATPHVAGAAALLKQQHPGWSAADLKAALVTTAAPGDYQVTQGGAGRVDLTRAVSQQAYGSPASVNLGAVRYAETGDYQPVTRQVTLHNLGTAARTFTLTDNGVNAAGTAIPADALTLSDTQVTVAAGATATVTVALDPNLLTRDAAYSGRITATAEDGTVVLFPFSVLMEKLLYDVAVTGVGRDGVAAGGPSQVALVGTTGRLFLETASFDGAGVATVRVPPGEYAMYANIFTPDAARTWIEEATAAYDSSFTVDRDIDITLDARAAREVVVDTGRTTEWQGGAFAYYPRGNDLTTLLPSDVKRISTLASEGTAGADEFAIFSSRTAPVLTAKVPGIALTPTPLDGAKQVSGRHNLGVVDAGTGTEEEFRRINAAGRLVLVTQSPDVPIATQIDNAARRGAAAVAVRNSKPGRLVAEAGSTAAPAFALYGEQGEQLAKAVARGHVRIALTGTPHSPFQYDLVHTVDSIPATGLRFIADASNTARIDADYYAHTARPGNLLQAWRRTNGFYSISTEVPIMFGAAHEEYVAADPKTVYWTGAELATGIATFERGWHAFTPGERRAVDWFKQVTNPTRGDTWLSQGYSSRVGSYLAVGAIPFPDSDPAHQPVVNWDDDMSLVLYRGDTEIGRNDYYYRPFYTDVRPGTYRAVMTIDRTTPGWEFSRSTRTEWTFGITESQVNRTIPAPKLAYDVPVDLRNRVGGGEQQTLTVHATPQRADDPAVTEVRTWISYDDGTTWTQLHLRPTDTAGEFTATVRLPRAETSSEYVTLRTEAVDASGNRIDQTVERAFGLK